jgi:hypothetical protein
MMQLAITDHLFHRLQRAARQRNTDVSLFLETMVEEYLGDDQYSEEEDPAIGFLSGPTDLSTKAKAILHEEVTEYSGWTQKPTNR